MPFPMFQVTLEGSPGRGIWFSLEGTDRGRVTCEALLPGLSGDDKFSVNVTGYH